jgi:hypothetical protein
VVEEEEEDQGAAIYSDNSSELSEIVTALETATMSHVTTSKVGIC